MATAARDTSAFFPTNEMQPRDGHFNEEISQLCGDHPALRNWFNAPRDANFPLSALADLAYNDASGHTAYFEANRPCEIGAVIYPGSTVPGTFSALTAEIRVTKDSSESSGMYGGTPVSIFAGSRVVMSCVHDTTLADSAQKWYLAAGDKVRIKLVPTGTSGSMASSQLQFQLLLRYR